MNIVEESNEKDSWKLILIIKLKKFKINLELV